MTTALIVAVVGLTTAGAWLLAVAGLGLRPGSAVRNLRGLVEAVGLGAGFLAVNLALGFALVGAMPVIADRFVSVYVLEDATLVGLSALQGLCLRWWLDRG